MRKYRIEEVKYGNGETIFYVQHKTLGFWLNVTKYAGIEIKRYVKFANRREARGWIRAEKKRRIAKIKSKIIVSRKIVG